MPTKIQDEPEKTLGKKPVRSPEQTEYPVRVPVRSGAPAEGEEADESEGGGNRDRAAREPPPIPSVE